MQHEGKKVPTGLAIANTTNVVRQIYETRGTELLDSRGSSATQVATQDAPRSANAVIPAVSPIGEFIDRSSKLRNTQPCETPRLEPSIDSKEQPTSGLTESRAPPGGEPGTSSIELVDKSTAPLDREQPAYRVLMLGVHPKFMLQVVQQHASPSEFNAQFLQASDRGRSDIRGVL